jgi:hypothetical protein
MQNFAVREFSVSQEGQRRVNADAHSSQNFALSGFSAPHFEQCIAPLPLEPYRPYGCYITRALARAPNSWSFSEAGDEACVLESLTGYDWSPQSHLTDRGKVKLKTREIEF